jgi:peptidoglycan glycosyltransferase
MIRELNRVAGALMVAFVVVALGTVFWTVVQADSLLARQDNARNVIAEQGIRRGAIFDQDGELLASSTVAEDGIARRVYPHPEAAGAVGYYSFKYGPAGIEAAYDAQLSGDDLQDNWQAFVDDTLHRWQRGSDIRSTIDLDVQLAAASALGNRSGAVVLVHVPSGRVLAMVSQPGYDPNSIDADWEKLTKNELTSPLLNRVTAGKYQPGGALQTVILAAVLAAHPDLSDQGGAVLNSEVPGALDPVQLDELVLTCLDETPEGDLTLAQSYAFGCPAPFVNALGEILTPERLWERFEAVGLLDVPVLIGFDPEVGNLPDAFTEATSPEALRASLAGQGRLTVTPLQMVQIVAAVANRGNAVPLHLVEAVRQPGSDDWNTINVPALQPALLREDVAAAVRLTMLQAAAESPYVRRATRGDLVLYGHSARSFAGPGARPFAWFLGFVDQSEGDDRSAIAVVVVVENESDPGVAADIAGAALEAAAVDNRTVE